MSDTITSLVSPVAKRDANNIGAGNKHISPAKERTAKRSVIHFHESGIKKSSNINNGPFNFAKKSKGII